jgi:hypothetical protein
MQKSVTLRQLINQTLHRQANWEGDIPDRLEKPKGRQVQPLVNKKISQFEQESHFATTKDATQELWDANSLPELRRMP